MLSWSSSELSLTTGGDLDLAPDLFTSDDDEDLPFLFLFFLREPSDSSNSCASTRTKKGNKKYQIKYQNQIINVYIHTIVTSV